MISSEQKGSTAAPGRVTACSAVLGTPLVGVGGCFAWDRLAAAQFQQSLRYTLSQFREGTQQRS